MIQVDRVGDHGLGLRSDVTPAWTAAPPNAADGRIVTGQQKEGLPDDGVIVAAAPPAPFPRIFPGL
jgi:hypothetical protein